METPIVTALIAAGAAVIAAFFAWRSSSKATDVNEQAANLAWVKELRQDAADARREVQQLRDEIRQVRRELAVAQGEADHWNAEHQTMRRHAWRPGMTIDKLRELLGPVDPAAMNGH